MDEALAPPESGWEHGGIGQPPAPRLKYASSVEKETTDEQPSSDFTRPCTMAGLTGFPASRKAFAKMCWTFGASRACRPAWISATCFPMTAARRYLLDLGPRPTFERWPASSSDLDDLRSRFDAADEDRLPEDWPDRVRAWRTRDHVLMLPGACRLFQSHGCGGMGALSPSHLPAQG